MADTSVPGRVKLLFVTMLIFNGILAWMCYAQLRLVGFPTAIGIVENLGIEQEESDISSSILHCPVVAFRYEVAGVSHRSDTFRKGGYCTSDYADAEQILQGLEVDTEVTVYFEPDEPEKGYLTSGLGRIEYTGLLFFLPFNLFTLGWILEIFSLKLFGHRLEPDVMRFGQDGSKAWAQFPRLGPIKFTLGVMLAISFLLIFPVMFFGYNLQADAFVKIWKALAALTVALLLGKMLWNRLRPSMAMYDSAREALTVPGGPVLQRSQIIDWEVEEISGKADKPLYFRPVLNYHDGNGTAQQTGFLTLSSREESYRFCDWLAQQLKLDP